ncbi:MAG TPA: methyltransferase domain-containing protein [Candidatus Limnocylindria bacterium]|nr:methyltransferase domain-containing protein [Candidatus Limnocylindria bacterium]
MQRASERPELLDGPLDGDLLKGNLRDMARVNRWLGGAHLSWRALERAWPADTPAGAPLRLLDVGTGRADIPLFLLERAARAGRALEIVATDVRPEIVALAKRMTAGRPGLTVEQSPAGIIDRPEASFDVVHASLVLHHLEPPAATGLLAEMARLSRGTVVVNDLVRARHWWLAAWLLSRVATGNSYTRHDAPLSVRRSYQPAELERLAAAAGLRREALLTDRLRHRYALLLRRG